MVPGHGRREVPAVTGERRTSGVSVFGDDGCADSLRGQVVTVEDLTKPIGKTGEIGVPVWALPRYRGRSGEATWRV